MPTTPLSLSCYLSGGDNDALRGATFVFVMGDVAFPSCNPTGRQDIVGMMGNGKHPDGVLSTFSDVAAAPVHIQSTSGKRTIVKTAVHGDGTKERQRWDHANYITTVNRLYVMQVSVVIHFPTLLDGYSVGKTTRDNFAIHDDSMEMAEPEDETANVFTFNAPTYYDLNDGEFEKSYVNNADGYFNQLDNDAALDAFMAAE
ncbi:hypothetical protein DYB32_010087, partial [Aphanomyces invadans]